jgi:hypothetical protein
MINVRVAGNCGRNNRSEERAEAPFRNPERGHRKPKEERMKKQKSRIAILESPVIFREDIIKQAAIESGLICESDNITIDRFLEAYKTLVKEYEMICVIFD